MLTKRVTTYHEQLQPSHICCQEFSWSEWQLDCSLADSKHAFSRPLCVSPHVLTGLLRKVHGRAELQISLDFC